MLAIEAHQVSLPRTPKVVVPPPVTDPKAIAQKWLTAFADVLASGHVAKLGTVLAEDGWWRDHLAVAWDLRTLHGLSKIQEYLKDVRAVQFSQLRLVDSGKYQPTLDTPEGQITWIESMFTFETAVARGKGMLRLLPEADGTYKAAAVYTCLQELKGHEEQVGDHRPHGGNNSLHDGVVNGNWLERRQREVEFLDGDPTVLIIGAGQSGLNVGARLKYLGVSNLLIDKIERVGDNWRNRYRTLVTHDPVQYTHMAYMPFPTNWPTFTPKDKLGDWFEYYAGAMELNIWLKSTVKSTVFDDAARTWTVEIARGDGTVRRLQPKHIVFCTGHAGEPLVPTFPGQADFEGVLYHGSQHKDASALGDLAGKRVVVVGTGNSGHDVAQNYYENGASVQMVQRRGTYVITANKGLFMLHEGIYDEHGPPTEDADIVGQSLPIPLQFAFNTFLTERITAADRAVHDGLARAGFRVDVGADGSGIYRKYITRGGGYYIDVGGSQLIIDGKIGVVQSPGGIDRLERDGLVLADGRRLPADIVVLATGFDNMRTSLRKVLGDAVADRSRDVWDLDDEGEVNAMWRPSGHPRLWYMGGSLALCRIYSRHLALQILAVELGLNKQ